MAVLVSLDDYERLQALEQGSNRIQEQRQAALAQAAKLRELILARRSGTPLPDSSAELNRLREESVHGYDRGD